MAPQLFLYCLCVIQIISGQFFSDPCLMVNNAPGTCLNIRSCQPFVNLLKRFGSHPKVKDLMRRSTCGFEGSTPKVTAGENCASSPEVCCPRSSLTTSTPQTYAKLSSPTISSPVTLSPMTLAPIISSPMTLAPVTSPPARGKVSIINKSSQNLQTDDILEFPSPPECGISNASFSRVVGGVDAKLGDFPWMALLGYRDRLTVSGTSWRCGASLISLRHVLTAAHCIHKMENILYVVRLGELDLSRADEGATPVDVLIKRMTKHEQYNPTSYENDIGVLVLQNDVQYSDLIRPICMPIEARMRSQDFEDWTPLIAGWGRLSANGPKATHLQVLQVPVLSAADCRDSYSAYGDQVVDERVLCAGYSSGGKDSCQGDSGGPLMQAMPTNLTHYFYEIGVVSFGPRECARPGLPGIYTRVTSYIPWLERQVLGSP